MGLERVDWTLNAETGVCTNNPCVRVDEYGFPSKTRFRLNGEPYCMLCLTQLLATGEIALVRTAPAEPAIEVEWA